MSWADAVPNLLIGLREGLEAGLVVTLLLAALRKTRSAGPVSTFPIWLGVVGAISVSASFAAVLTYSTSVLDSAAQEAIGGTLSVLAVGLVTWMVFWMRRTARSLSGDLTEKVGAAAQIGVGALAMTAFLSVGREGLETTLFIWTAVKASGQTVAPVIGAGVGIAIAVVLCSLLYRGAVRVNLGVFFSRTAIVLIVIAAGILSYGLGDLQDAGILPGQNWVAFDITGTVAADSWWMSLVTGVTELSTRMTVLQVAAWVVYLALVVPAFVRAGRAETAPAAAVVPAVTETEAPDPAHRPWFERTLRAAEKRVWVVVGGIVVLPALVATVIIVAIPVSTSSQTAVTVTATSCASGWTTGRTGDQTFTVTNSSTRAGEVNLDNSSGAIVGEIESLGPATSAALTATLSPGTYTFKCFFSGEKVLTGTPVAVTGSTLASVPTAVTPPTLAELTGPNHEYQAYAATELTALAKEVAAIDSDLSAGNRPAAEADWLAAQEDWERVGASYDSFGDLGLAVDGLPDGYPLGVQDPGFTGLHRLEYGLWHGQSTADLQQVTATLASNVAKVQKHLTSDDLTGDPTNLPIRTHEILEDALRDHLSELDDQGAGAAYPETYADTEITGTLLTDLSPLLSTRAPHLVATARQQLATLQAALLATRVDGRWVSPEATPLASRQRVDAAIGSLLENLSSVPDLLEVAVTP
ncbi:MAG: iron permease family protein [Frondihabitans sp.]|nr:iron permease family protein [Frondihabitans sp.]